MISNTIGRDAVRRIFIPSVKLWPENAQNALHNHGLSACTICTNIVSYGNKSLTLV